jgi:N6-adenosine-specific RNA methylase IME4
MTYALIYADPPWNYRAMSDARNGSSKSAMTTQGSRFIASIPVEQFAASNSILALWATLPKLDQAFEVMKEWGFAYVTAIPWMKTRPSDPDKIKLGVGFWTMGVCEVLLIGRRGQGTPCRLMKHETPPGLLIGDRENPVFWCPPERAKLHSSKPVGVREWLQARHDGPSLELFARFGLGHNRVGKRLQFGNFVAHAAVPPMVIPVTRRVG